MRRVVGPCAAALMLLVVLTGCAGAASEVVVGPDDDGGAVTIGIGQVLVVELPGNPTTGYTWSAFDPPAFITQVGEPEFEADSDLVGAGGMVTLRFSGDEPGEASLELQYARPWESVQPEQVYRIDVTVR